MRKSNPLGSRAEEGWGARLTGARFGVQSRGGVFRRDSVWKISRRAGTLPRRGRFTSRFSRATRSRN